MLLSLKNLMSTRTIDYRIRGLTEFGPQVPCHGKSRKRDSFAITFGGGSVGGEGTTNRRSDLATPRFSSVAYEQKSPVQIYAVIHEKHTAAHHHAKKSVKIIQFNLLTTSALTTSWSALDFIPIIITEQVKKSDAEGVKHVINISPVVLMLPKRQSFKQNK